MRWLALPASTITLLSRWSQPSSGPGEGRASSQAGGGSHQGPKPGSPPVSVVSVASVAVPVPPGLAATHDIDLPGVHLWIEPGEAGYDAAVARLDRDATSADGTFTSEVRERGQLAAGIWILYRSSYRGDVGAHYFKAIQRFLDHVQQHDRVWVCRRIILPASSNPSCAG